MIKRFFATKDAQIVNARRHSLLSSGSLSNMGLADSGEIFSIYNITGFNTSTSQNDLSRILISFDVDSIFDDIDIPQYSSSYFLRMFNVKHDESLPKNYKLCVHPVTKSWDEGFGLDLDNYLDIGAVNWISASDGVVWENQGSDYIQTTSVEQTFTNGYEDLEIDITSFVSLWRSGTLSNNGMVVKLSSTYENMSETFYKKMFSLRGSEYWFNRPCIEVRWDDSLFDDRNNSYFSSSLATSEDNLNTLYLYNRIRGRLLDIPSVGQGNIYVSFYSASTGTGSFVTAATGTWAATGTYKVQFYTTYTGTLYDRWHNNSPVQHPTSPFYSSSTEMKNFLEDFYSSNDEFILSMPNLKAFYDENDKVRFDLFIRKRNWKPTVYTVASQQQDKEYIKKAFYQIKRSVDDKIIIPFGTGSLEYTKLSYDKDGNYFNLDMSIFEPDYQYEINYMFNIDSKKILQKDTFKFRVQSRYKENNK